MKSNSPLNLREAILTVHRITIKIQRQRIYSTILQSLKATILTSDSIVKSVRASSILSIDYRQWQAIAIRQISWHSSQPQTQSLWKTKELYLTRIQTNGLSTRTKLQNRIGKIANLPDSKHELKTLTVLTQGKELLVKTARQKLVTSRRHSAMSSTALRWWNKIGKKSHSLREVMQTMPMLLVLEDR